MENFRFLNKGQKIVKNKKKKNISGRLFDLLSISVILLFIAGLLVYFFFAKKIPDVDILKQYKPSLITRIFSDDGDLIEKYYVENRILVSIKKIPTILKQASIAVEDAKFFSHFGIDFQGIGRAFWNNMLKGRVVEGGSTITQQLAKTLFLSPEKTITRKIKEAILAIKIEKKFSKNEILEFYLNQIYYGHGAYGVEAAANTYFGKQVENLNIAEAAMIAGLPKAPNHNSPYFFPKKALKRRSHVLKRMVSMGFITKKEAQEARESKFILSGREKQKSKAPYFTENIRKYLEKKFGSSKLYRGGLKIDSTLNLQYQEAAEKSVKEELEKADKRYGYRGPLKKLNISSKSEIDWNIIEGLRKKIIKNYGKKNIENDNNLKIGVVIKTSKKKITVLLNEENEGIINLKNMRWARKPNHKIDGKYFKQRYANRILHTGDVILVKILKNSIAEGTVSLALEQLPEVQGALFAIDPQTGFIRAMVGGYDYSKSQFNRATQAIRQPGSAFKPIIYSAALQKGFTPASIIIDSPIIYKDDSYSDKLWKPEAFEKKFFGPTTLRTALTHSRNIIAIKLLKKIGIDYVIKHSRKLGINQHLNADLSLALGSSGVTLQELTSAYGVLANRGIRSKPLSITKITDRDGNILENNIPESEDVLSEEISFIITNMLNDVVKYGTGRSVKSLGRPVGGKTGTTNNFIDAWFIGFVPKLVTGVWVGMDKKKPLGKNETGARAAAPIWLKFMKKAVIGTPIIDFPIPPNVLFAKINPKTGILARYGDKDAYFEAFVEGTEPTKYTKKEDITQKNFFELDLE